MFLGPVTPNWRPNDFVSMDIILQAKEIFYKYIQALNPNSNLASKLAANAFLESIEEYVPGVVEGRYTSDFRKNIKEEYRSHSMTWDSNPDLKEGILQYCACNVPSLKYKFNKYRRIDDEWSPAW